MIKLYSWNDKTTWKQRYPSMSFFLRPRYFFVGFLDQIGPVGDKNPPPLPCPQPPACQLSVTLFGPYLGLARSPWRPLISCSKVWTIFSCFLVWSFIIFHFPLKFFSLPEAYQTQRVSIWHGNPFWWQRTLVFIKNQPHLPIKFLWIAALAEKTLKLCTI